MTAELISPGTGQAMVVRRGQVLVIEQLHGRQVVDLNLFCLADGREHLSASRTRALHGLSIAVGDHLWSAAPRERPLMTLIGDSAGGRHDVSFPACSAFEYRQATGISGHTNCADIQAESIRRFGLTPDHVHDPLNLWMEGGGGSDNQLWWRPVPSAPGDRVELLAQVAVVASFNPCGDDLFDASGYEVSPVLASLRDATEAERAALVPARRRGPAGGARRLEADPGYVPGYRTSPLRRRSLEVELPDGARGRLDALRRHGGFGESDGEIVRAVLFSWWLEHHARMAATPGSSRPGSAGSRR
jgi:uncharacterized protein YcgI (DUF1989 family)